MISDSTEHLSLKPPKKLVFNLDQTEIPVFVNPSTPYGNVCKLQLDARDPTTHKTFRELILAKVRAKKWYIIAACVSAKAETILMFDGWRFASWINCCVLINPKIIDPVDFVLFRTKVTYNQKMNTNEVSFKQLCKKDEFLARNSVYPYIVGALDDDIPPEDRYLYHGIVANAKCDKKGHSRISPNLIPLSTYRWWEKAMDIGDGYAAVLLGTDCSRHCASDSAYEGGFAYKLAKRCFENCLMDIVGHTTTPDELYTKLTIFLQTSEDSQRIGNAISAIRGLELCFQYQGINDLDSDTKRVVFIEKCSKWFQDPTSVEKIKAVIKEREKKTKTLSESS